MNAGDDDVLRRRISGSDNVGGRWLALLCRRLVGLAMEGDGDLVMEVVATVPRTTIIVGSRATI